MLEDIEKKEKGTFLEKSQVQNIQTNLHIDLEVTNMEMEKICYSYFIHCDIRKQRLKS